MAKTRYQRYQVCTKAKGKSYIYQYIAKLTYSGGKTHREILERFGVASTEVIKEIDRSVDILNYFEELEQHSNVSNNKHDHFPLIESTGAPCYLIPAVGYEIWKEWGFDQFFKLCGRRVHSGKVTTTESICAAALLRLNGHMSGLAMGEQIQKTAIGKIIGADMSSFNCRRLARDLEVLSDVRTDLSRHIHSRCLEKGWSKGRHFFTDTTSWNFQGATCSLGKYGKCKDGKGNHFVFMLGVVPEGFTVYWECHPGNTADTTLIENFANKLAVELKMQTFDICLNFDRGFVSNKVLTSLHEKGFKFVSALDGPQVKHFDSLLDFTAIAKVIKDYCCFRSSSKQATSLKKYTEEFIKLGLKATPHGKTFYKRVTFSVYEIDQIKEATDSLEFEERYYFLAISPENAYQKVITRLSKGEKIEEEIEKVNLDQASAKRNRTEEAVDKTLQDLAARFKVEFEYTIRKIKVGPKKIRAYKVGLESIEPHSKYDGVWICVTNCADNTALQYSFESSVEAYSAKVKVEDCIRILSHIVKLEPIERVNAKMVEGLISLCVISQNIDALMAQRLRNEEGVDIGLERLFSTLETCRIIDLHIKDRTISLITKIDPEQLNLVRVLQAGNALTSATLSKLGVQKFNATGCYK